MRSNRKVLFTAVTTLLASLMLTAFSVAQAATPVDISSIKIKNFGKMDDRFFRGAQPKSGDFATLAALGIKTVIDLRDDPVSYEKSAVETAGMRYVNIPMSDSSYPKDETISTFLKVVNDPVTGPFYVHCAGGRHRTGVMGAVYRFTHDHWSYDQAYAEMKTYDFYTRFGHGAMKKFVEDYWQHMQASSPSTTAPAQLSGARAGS